MSTRYDELLAVWSAAGGQPGWPISEEAFDALAELLSPELRTLEFGSGLSTLLFDGARCDHRAIEHDPTWFNRVIRLVSARSVELCRIVGNWYAWNWNGPKFDVVMIDGPPSCIGRSGVLRVADKIIGPETTVFVDDSNRKEEGNIVQELSRRFRRRTRSSRPDAYQRTFSILEA